MYGYILLQNKDISKYIMNDADRVKKLVLVVMVMIIMIIIDMMILIMMIKMIAQ